ncbi:MAG: replication-associated recombination protein A [Clostridiaceae bacterium]|nr:replication-associated recombination protein A [Clostridiaceae bacterium]
MSPVYGSTRWEAPLAFRMMPRTMNDFVGQSHILGEGKLLWRMITADRLSSIILFGPPGSGKTSLARIIANTTKSNFERLNAVTSGVADIKRVISDTENPLLTPGGRTVLFIDEIHRFNKSQQDALLPSVESGRLILIGATTENPFFQVNKALISRSTVFQLYPLTKDDVKEVLTRALTDEIRGLGRLDIVIDDTSIDLIAELAGGDARVALNALELAVMTTSPDSNGSIVIDSAIVMDSMQKKIARYDRAGEEHYDNISAMIKSMRGSDPDAAIFYFARALRAGEDIQFIARRIAICAAEDVGMANPQILSIALDAWQAASMIGLPEARIPLAQAVIAVATSPKSNASYLAIEKALQDLESRDTGNVPFHLRNAPVKGMEELGYAKGYEYSHDYPDAISSQTYLPDEIAGTIYYTPTDHGYEKKIGQWMAFVDSRRKAMRAKIGRDDTSASGGKGSGDNDDDADQQMIDDPTS